MLRLMIALYFLLPTISTPWTAAAPYRNQSAPQTYWQFAWKLLQTNNALHKRVLHSQIKLTQQASILARCTAGVDVGTHNRPAKSCQEILTQRPNASSAIYYIKSGGKVEKVYCHMESLGSCGGGGWTTLMKVDGRQATFEYRSRHWTTATTYSVGGGRTGFDSQETKLNTFNSMPFKELCIVFKHPSSGQMGYVPVIKTAESLLSVMKEDRFSEISTVGRSAWLNSIPDASLQPNCNRNGFNVAIGERLRVRVGIVANNEDDCTTVDTIVGVGINVLSTVCHCLPCSYVYAGHFHGCRQHVSPTYAYILAQ